MSNTRRATSLRVGGHLGIDQAMQATLPGRSIRLAPGAAGRIRASAARIARAVNDKEWVYGVTTGFGSNADTAISADEVTELQHNLIQSHAMGDGDPLPDTVVRLALFLRIHALAQGHSGLRRSTLDTMVALYEHDILAEVPSRGSVGASGDLAPLSHLALPMIGKGYVRSGGRRTTARAALKRAGIKAVRLAAKEGLALVNGMQVTLSIALHAWREAATLLATADVAAAMTAEALAGRSEAFDDRLHAARHHPEQRASAKRIRTLLRGSKLIDAPSHAIPGKRISPQDAYGIRCAPQVHGAAAEGMRFGADVFAREINAATDNPLVFGEDILSGGNFHGEALGLAADHLRLCIHELGSLSERRTATLVDEHMNEGLPPYLAPQKGLHSGFMIPQYVAAALASESKGLCMPASADSIPTGANIEDHVSMAPIAARRCLDVAELVCGILAIELMAAAQAIDLRTRAPSRPIRQVVDTIRERVPFRDKDRLWDDSLAQIRTAVADGSILAAAQIKPLAPPRS